MTSSSGSETSSAIGRSRVEWVDISKGFAIVLVVLYHAVLLLRQAELAPPYWNTINSAFHVFRMPLFFFAAGLFASSTISRPWSGLWRSRLALLVWMYVVWGLMRFGYFLLIPNPSDPDETSVLNLLLSPVWPTSGLWFLHALVVFLIAAKLMKQRVPNPVQVGLAAVASIVMFSNLSTGNVSYDGILRYFVFFIAACHHREFLIAQIRGKGWFWAIGSGLIFSAVAAAIVLSPNGDLPGVPFLASIFAIGTGCLIAANIAGYRVGAAFGFLGANTLPIYVSHVIILSALVALLRPAADSRTVQLVGPALPVITAAVAIAVSLGVWRFLRAPRATRWLYVPPEWFLGRDFRRGDGRSARSM
jgi:uncharacterized membrane protein YcfT